MVPLPDCSESLIKRLRLGDGVSADAPVLVVRTILRFAVGAVWSRQQPTERSCRAHAGLPSS
jgi:hypothetical protein